MPSDKKRINLTIPDEIYQQLQVFKQQNGVSSDATACLQLIVQQLRAQETSKTLLDFMRRIPLDSLKEFAQQGADDWANLVTKLDEEKK